jgi:hypothetical protein
MVAGYAAMVFVSALCTVDTSLNLCLHSGTGTFGLGHMYYYNRSWQVGLAAAAACVKECAAVVAVTTSYGVTLDS